MESMSHERVAEQRWKKMKQLQRLQLERSKQRELKKILLRWILLCAACASVVAGLVVEAESVGAVAVLATWQHDGRTERLKALRKTN